MCHWKKAENLSKDASQRQSPNHEGARPEALYNPATVANDGNFGASVGLAELFCGQNESNDHKRVIGWHEFAGQMPEQRQQSQRLAAGQHGLRHKDD